MQSDVEDPGSRRCSNKMILVIALISSISIAIIIGFVVVKFERKQSPEIVYVNWPTTDLSTPEPAILEKMAAVDSVSVVIPWTNFRLRDTMRPSHYSIHLNPNFDEDFYKGNVAITFRTSEETHHIIFHVHYTLWIIEESLSIERVNSKSKVAIAQYFRWPENDFYVVQTERKLSKDEGYILSMHFMNDFANGTAGIFKAYYVDPATSETKFVMASHFQPTMARRGYPCFDEPAMKAEFTMSVEHDSNYTALSNMPVESRTQLKSGRIKTVFQRSVPMSTYLTCFVVGELKYVEAFSSRNIPLRIYAAPHLIDDGLADWSLKTTVAMFDRYQELFNMTYPLPKYDQVSLPVSRFGAKEHWGIATFRNKYLMLRPQEATTLLKHTAVKAIAHEMAHQWLGNTVTMKWWDNLWLSEGFAQYFQYRGMKWANPVWQAKAHYLVDNIHAAMRADQTLPTSPLKMEVNDSQQLARIFNEVVYKKGSAVINMMEYMFGEDIFIGGLRHYLKKRKFSVATEQDLWADFQEYVTSENLQYDVKFQMDPWVQQKGYPVVKVATCEDEVFVTQRPAFVDTKLGVTALPPGCICQWNINLNYYTQNAPDTIFRGWLVVGARGVRFNIPDRGDWIKFNEREQIFHRVNYEPDMWESIATQLSTDLTAFSEMDRSHIVDDVFNLARTKRIEYTQALNVTRYLNNEKSYFVWKAFHEGISYLRAMFLGKEEYADMQEYYSAMIRSIVEELGWDANVGTHEEKLLRPILLSLAVRFGDGEAFRNAKSLFVQWKADIYIHPDVRPLVFQCGIEGGTHDDWLLMLEKYKNAKNAAERHDLLIGLASTQDVKIVAELFNLLRDPTVISDQEFFDCLIHLASNSRWGNFMIWAWIRVNWDYLVDRFGPGNTSLKRLFSSIVKDYNTELEKWEVTSFFDANPDGTAALKKEVALSQIDSNIAWMDRNFDSIAQWLENAVTGL